MESLSLQDLHHLAMNHVGKELEKQGFEFIAINSQLKKHPQFVCVDKPTNTLHFVMVQAVTYPDNPAEELGRSILIENFLVDWDLPTTMTGGKKLPYSIEAANEFFAQPETFWLAEKLADLAGVS